MNDGGRSALSGLSSDWYWEQDAELRFTRVDVQIGAPGEQELARQILGRTRWETGIHVEGGWDASTSAQAAAGTDGITLTSSFVGGVAIYQLTDRGLMAQADVSGTRFWVIDELN